MSFSLPKSERLSGQKAVSALFEGGKSLTAGCLRCKYLPGSEVSRIVVTVPKRLFKRAVKRNLLKRRIREAYRLQKDLLQTPVDILFIYSAPDVLPYEAIFADMTEILQKVC